MALVAVFFIPPMGSDWDVYFRPAAQALIRGESPYMVDGFYNPFWTLLPMIPFAILPAPIGRVGFFLLSFLALGYLLYKLEVKPLGLFFFMTCFPVVACLQYGEIDWLPMLALVTPAPASILLAMTKPQIGIGMGVYWLVTSYNAGGAWLVVKNFYPAIILLMLSFLFYGNWLASTHQTLRLPWNLSIFPYLIPLGVYLLWTRKKQNVLMAGLCLTPYLTVVSLMAFFIAWLKYPVLGGTAWAVSWLYAWVR